MKKLLAMILASAMVLSLAACGSGSASSAAADTKEAASAAASEVKEAASAAASAATEAASAAASEVKEAASAVEEAATEAASAATEAASAATEAASAATEAVVGDVPDLGDFTLTFSSHDPETSDIMKATQAYFDKINEVTNGHVTVEPYYSAVMAGVKDVGDMVSSGGVDMGWIYTSYYPTQFTLSDVITLPLQGFGDNVKSTQLLWDLYTTVPEMAAQWDNEYKVLQLYANPPMILETLDPITDVSQIKGKNIRVPAGAITDILATWGAAGVTMGPPDIYEAMEKRNVDGYIFEEAGSRSFSLFEVTNYCLDMPLFVGAFSIAVNWDSWNQLPAEYQAAIESISGYEASMVSAQAFEDSRLTGRQAAIDDGVEFLVPTDEELAGWKAACDEYAAKWAEDITNSTGIDGAAYLAKAQELYAGY